MAKVALLVITKVIILVITMVIFVITIMAMMILRVYKHNGKESGNYYILLVIEAC